MLFRRAGFHYQYERRGGLALNGSCQKGRHIQCATTVVSGAFLDVDYFPEFFKAAEHYPESFFCPHFVHPSLYPNCSLLPGPAQYSMHLYTPLPCLEHIC